MSRSAALWENRANRDVCTRDSADPRSGDARKGKPGTAVCGSVAGGHGDAGAVPWRTSKRSHCWRPVLRPEAVAERPGI